LQDVVHKQTVILLYNKKQTNKGKKLEWKVGILGRKTQDNVKWQIYSQSTKQWKAKASRKPKHTSLEIL